MPVSKDYTYDVNVINYSLNYGVVSLEFEKENEFQDWFMDLSIKDYKGISYRLTNIVTFHQSKTDIEIPNLPKTYTSDSIKQLNILANQQKCHLFKNEQAVQKPIYQMTSPGKLSIHDDISKSKLIRIETEAWKLKGKDRQEFSKYLDSLLKF